MNQNAGAERAVAADFAGFTKVLGRMFDTELESFQGLSGHYGIYEDVDGLMQRIRDLASQLTDELAALGSGAAAAVAAQVGLLDSMLELLDRYVQVADLRGATLTSGDLLKKLQGWIRLLREWLSGIGRQLVAMAAAG